MIFSATQCYNIVVTFLCMTAILFQHLNHVLCAKNRHYKSSHVHVISSLARVDCIYAGLSSRAGGWGFSPATKRVAPGYFYWKMEEK